MGKRRFVIVLVVALVALSGASGCGTLLDVEADPDPVAQSDAGSADGGQTGDAASSGHDGSPEVGTDAAANHIVFVTSAVSTGNNVGAGDGRCAAAATAAKRSGRFVAFLSTSSVPASTSLQEYGPWFTTKGNLVATSKTDLLDGRLSAPIDADENGTAVIGKAIVWTGTTPAGTATADNCVDWSGTAAAGTTGVTDAVDGQWTQTSATTECFTSPAHLYCFEQAPTL